MLGSSLLLLFVLVICSAFLPGAEIACMTVSDLKMRYLVEQKRKNAKILYNLKQNPHRLLVTILIGNNIANISAASVATTLGQSLFNNYGVGIAIGAMTLIILIFGEIFPKDLSVRYSERIALLIAPVILFFTYLFYPLSISLNFIDKLLKRISPENKEPLITEEEVQTIIRVGEDEGAIEKEAHKMIRGVFELDDTEVTEIMVPRVDMYVLDYNKTVREVIDEVIEKGYSRIPVFENTVDNIKGVLYVKDMLKYLSRGSIDTQIREVMKPAMFITENRKINNLLKQFKDKKNHMALVVDEYGGIQGLVTIEDILEELVGEIYDETDVPQKMINVINERTAKVNGGTNLDEVNEMLNLELDEHEDYETISGYILHQIKRVPEEGEELFIGNLKFVIATMEGNRIKEVTITKLSDESPGGNGE
ncbi:HlyC/CorC family transporter [bacterium]|nr:HlyC/CorC family transporter [bacterium]